jgi:3',5'-cyclic AMP phosphodiesterase CpdA
MVIINKLFILATVAFVAALSIPVISNECSYNSDNITFISVGDWGGAALGGYHLKNAQETAKAMYKYAHDCDAEFVLNNGDSFYYCGIQNTSDLQINQDYTALFDHVGLPWYSGLGNHDYGFNPEAQLELHTVIPHWIMDGRYYHRLITINSVNINLVFLDTNPCINDYRGDDKAKWDPCSTEFPTCGPEPGVCMFHENILAQDCAPQRQWFADTLASIPDNQWTIVVGHHRAEQLDNQEFQSLFDSHKVHLYINGHVHSLEHYAINGQSKYITSGAASMVVPGNNFLKIFGQHGRAANIWNKLETGFATHTISGNTLTTDFRNSEGTILHSFSVSK